jgi:hypothetical protein
MRRLRQECRITLDFRESEELPNSLLDRNNSTCVPPLRLRGAQTTRKASSTEAEKTRWLKGHAKRLRARWAERTGLKGNAKHPRHGPVWDRGWIKGAVSTGHSRLSRPPSTEKFCGETLSSCRVRKNRRCNACPHCPEVRAPVSCSLANHRPQDPITKAQGRMIQ